MNSIGGRETLQQSGREECDAYCQAQREPGKHGHKDAKVFQRTDIFLRISRHQVLSHLFILLSRLPLKLRERQPESH